MLWHPKTLQNLAMYNVFFIFGRFSIAGKLPKWPKIPFQYPLALRHPKILEKCRKHHRILVSVRNRFWAPPAKADIATAILTNVIEHLVLLFCPPISTPSPPKRCGRIYMVGDGELVLCGNNNAINHPNGSHTTYKNCDLGNGVLCVLLTIVIIWNSNRIMMEC